MLVALPQLKSVAFAWSKGRVVFPLCLLFFCFYFLSDYLEGTTTALLAGYAAIAATTAKTQYRKLSRFVLVAPILLILTWLVPVKTLLYFALSTTFFCWIEMQQVRIHFLGVVALFFSSPAFQYAAGIFSFPIRLQLTKAVGAVFSLFASNLELKGNVILYEGHEFAVDPACMGLHMLSISLLLGIFLLGLLQRKAGKIVNWKIGILYLLCLFVLNLLANVLRIILLVQFAIPPEAIMHDVIGLACLVLYVCLPACYLAKLFVSKARVEITAVQQPDFKRHLPVFHWILLAGLLLVAHRVVSIDTYSKFSDKYTEAIAGYSSSVYAPGIVKLENAEALLYIKFIRGFYDTEHNPAMCWKGSGYVFKDIKTQVLEGKEVYTASLHKGNDKLYTSWWYGNADHVTTSQWEWRWNMVKSGQSYAVINVTAANEKTLRAEVKKLLSTKTLKPFFNKGK
ncbi:MAG TPA: exosortase N [Flavisolibacter sp.]